MHWLCLFILYFSLSLSARDLGVVHHPVPKPPLYLKEGWYESLKAQFPPPPTLESVEQKHDEQELFKLQKERTPIDCERAKSEIFVSLKNFFGQEFGLLNEKDLEKLGPFFEQIRNDSDFFIQKLKVDYPRKRPFLYIQGLEPCIPKEVTGAYPSGHGVLSELYFLILSELFPNLKGKLEQRAHQIAQDRVIAGVHHPSDIEAGKKVALLIFNELKKSKEFQKAFSQFNFRV